MTYTVQGTSAICVAKSCTSQLYLHHLIDHTYLRNCSWYQAGMNVKHVSCIVGEMQPQGETAVNSLAEAITALLT